MENVLLVFVVFQALGFALFGKFQTEAPWWQMFFKWMIILGLAYALFTYFGEIVTLVTFGILLLLSIIIHVTWCLKKGIHPLKATPGKKYYALRGWNWKE
jgi:hypothetical protein